MRTGSRYLALKVFSISFALGVASLFAVAGHSTNRHFGIDGQPVQATPALGPGEVDIGFAQSMAVHHDQAVILSKAVQGKVTMQTAVLADQILTVQLLEIGNMKGWLLAWGKPPMPGRRSMKWMLDTPSRPSPADLAYIDICRASRGGMPGMASTGEIEELRLAEGEDARRLFLQLMLRHHEGALPMAQFAANNASLAFVRAAAARMVYDQRKEILLMRRMLESSE